MPKRTATSPLAGEHPAKTHKKADSSDVLEQSPSEANAANKSVDEDGFHEEVEATSTIRAIDKAGKNDSNAEDSGDGEQFEYDRGAINTKARTTRKPVRECFHAWGTAFQKPNVPLPMAHNFWGCKPVLNDQGPRPPQLQPSAKASNGASNPDLWEDRGYIFEQGSRYRKYVGEKPEGINIADLSASIDQQAAIALKLIDMRPDRKGPNAQPRRRPHVYIPENGTPKDWNDKQAIKCLNDRRRDAIDRITLDPPWTYYEREYLAELIRDYPNGSMWDWTERHNYYFVGNYRWPDGHSKWMDLSEGRTVESVTDEYRKYKLSYDKGEAPPEKWEVRRAHRNAAGDDVDEERIAAFHSAYKGLMTNKMKARISTGAARKKREDGDQEDLDNQSVDPADGSTKIAKSKKKKRKATLKKKDSTSNNDFMDELDGARPRKILKKPITLKSKKPKATRDRIENSTPRKKEPRISKEVVSEDENDLDSTQTHSHAGQEPLNSLGEELNALVGSNNVDENRRSPPHQLPPDSPETGEPGPQVCGEGVVTHETVLAGPISATPGTIQSCNDDGHSLGSPSPSWGAARQICLDEFYDDLDDDLDERDNEL